MPADIQTRVVRHGAGAVLRWLVLLGLVFARASALADPALPATESPAVPLPVETASPLSSPADGKSGSNGAAGWEDVSAGVSPASEATVRVLEPLGTVGFSFSLLPLVLEDGFSSPQLVDLDRDLRADLVSLRGTQVEIRTRLLDTDAARIPSIALPFHAAQLAIEDLDRDGQLDLVLVDREGRSLWCAWMRGTAMEKLDRCAGFDSVPHDLYLVPAKGSRPPIIGVLLHPTPQSSRIIVATPAGRSLSLRIGHEISVRLTGLRLGDMSGSGRIDAVAFAPFTRTMMVSLGTEESPALRPWVPRHWFWESYFTEELWSRSVLGRFSNDDTVNLLLQVGQAGAWRIGRFGEGRGFRALERLSIPPYVQVHDQLVGNFDGDGMDDIAIRGVQGRTWFAGLSSYLGDSLVEVPAGGWGENGCTGIGSGDLNGDGIADLVARCSAGSGGMRLGWGSFSAVTPVPGATVQVNGAPVVLDERGERNVPVPADVAPQLPPGVYFPGRRRVEERSNVTFLKQPVGTLVTKTGPKAPRPYVPSVCVGFNPEASRPWGELVEQCAEGYAVMSVDDPARATSTASALMRVLCCPLPSSDMLTDEHVEVEEQCPEDFIVTGGSPPIACETCPKKFRCTKINTDRYQLGAPTPAAYWGSGMSMFHQGSRIHKAAIPVALRFGVGRTGESAWDDDGCISEQWGSVLVTKSRSQCSNYLFRRFEYTGAIKGDPAPGTPVKVLPDCASISSPFDRFPKCNPPQ